MLGSGKQKNKFDHFQAIQVKIGGYAPSKQIGNYYTICQVCRKRVPYEGSSVSSYSNDLIIKTTSKASVLGHVMNTASESETQLYFDDIFLLGMKLLGSLGQQTLSLP